MSFAALGKYFAKLTKLAVEPATGWTLAMPFGDVNTATMQAFLAAAASKLHRREHAVMIFDGAGWQCVEKLRWPRRITPEDEGGPVLYESNLMLARRLVKAQRREAWGESLQDAVSSVVRPRPHGRSAFTLSALEREDHV